MTSRKTLFAALAAFALLASPALAGNGHGNGGGNGHGGGNGNGNGGGSGNAGGNSGNSGSHGKSASAKGHVGKAETAVASVDDTEQTASVTKEKNIHAKLGRLNSLQRNINAYMNSKSKKFAGIQAFVTQSAVAKNAEAAAADAAAAVDAAKAAVIDQQAAYDAANLITPPTPEEQLAQDAQIAALEQAVVDAQKAADTAQDEADAAAADIPSLDTALADMANKPVDTEVTDWANGVLADKIDQMAAKLAPAP